MIHQYLPERQVQNYKKLDLLILCEYYGNVPMVSIETSRTPPIATPFPLYYPQTTGTQLI